MIMFTVYGAAKPAGSKKAIVDPRSGRAMVVEDSRNKSWRQEVTLAALEAMGDREPLEGPLVARFVFVRPRPASHYGSGKNERRLKESAPAFPTTRPDVLKLSRLVEDALSGVCYRDDAQIVDERLRKVYGVPERCIVEIEEAG